VLGVDASLPMLEHAAAAHDPYGWGPRLVCADAFHLPLGEATVDCVTVAFGVRNLRPRREALAEIARCLKPGGTLVVLEATAPGAGPFAPLHRFYLRRLVPLAGRLSPDPSAYVYLSRSIMEFGSGPEFESDLAASGFVLAVRRSFLLGATRLWAARRLPGGADAGAARKGAAVHSATLGELPRGEMPHAVRRAEAEWRGCPWSPGNGRGCGGC
jgi:demethylmenaquinone methyltransferase/2-methoxy-6-polyprenyl-1,4-benzoquinol methylase